MTFRYLLSDAVTPPPASTPNRAIPYNNSTGISGFSKPRGAAQVGSIEVSVDISHTWIGDLRVSLVSPAGTEAVLHDGTGNSAHNLMRVYTHRQHTGVVGAGRASRGRVVAVRDCGSRGPGGNIPYKN